MRRDDNEAELLREASKMGMVWVEGPPLDGWIGFAGYWVPTEIKQLKRKGHANEFQPKQKKFMGFCIHNGLPYEVWRELSDLDRFRGKYLKKALRQ